ncbi:E3 ubiquitin protein ligase RGLG2-like protein [Tanacetum coccineum]|uniref:E3 ubiquitin protein ligase RGLG2-like protein n=1 Tax=Tanacetum coccineum TaxID=301880 RepID=A0ABQ5AB19_9ASTR
MARHRVRAIRHVSGLVVTISDRSSCSCRLESSNLIVGIDFTKSNEWTVNVGSLTLRFCYQPATSTRDQDVFSFYPEEIFCNGFEDVLSRYKEIVPHLKLAGPTSFAPVIEQAMTNR